MSDNNTCQICYDQSSEVLKLDECEHSFCKGCFMETYRALIEDQNGFDKLVCPQYGCKVRPSEDEIKKIVDGHVFVKYQKFKRNKQVANDKNLVFCGKPGCEQIIQFDQVKKNILKCPTCEHQMCSKCYLPAHGWRSCRDVEDKGLKDWMRSKGAPKLANCPNCGVLCEKLQGCPHMRCEVCGYDWCWTCGMKRNNWFHRLQGDSEETGALCEFVNEDVYGSDGDRKCSKIILRFFLVVLAWVFLPPLVAVFIPTIIGPYVFNKECTYPCYNIYGGAKRIIIRITIFLVLYPIIVLVLSLVAVVALVFFYPITIFLGIRIIIQCCKCNRNITENDQVFEAQYERAKRRNLENLDKNKKYWEEQSKNQKKSQVEKERQKIYGPIQTSQIIFSLSQPLNPPVKVETQEPTIVKTEEKLLKIEPKVIIEDKVPDVDM